MRQKIMEVTFGNEIRIYWEMTKKQYELAVNHSEEILVYKGKYFIWDEKDYKGGK